MGSFKEVSQIIANVWQSMPESEKSVWRQKSDLVRTQIAKGGNMKYKKNVNPYIPGASRGKDVHKRKISPYSLWTKSDIGKQIFQQNKGKTVTEILRIRGQIWRSMPDSEKSVWIEQSKTLRNQIALRNSENHSNQPSPSEQIQINETTQKLVDNTIRSSPKPESRSKVQGQNHEHYQYLMFHVYCAECSKIIDSSTLWLHFQEFPDHTDCTKSLTEFNQFDLKLREDSCAKRRSLARQVRGNDCPRKLSRSKGKRTPNAYLLFANEMRKKGGNQGKSRSEVAQNESEKWRSMPEAEKAIWRLRYAEKKTKC